MGLKTTNYTSKKNGLKLDTAYAVVRDLHIEGKYGEAEFAIHYSRDEVMSKPALEIEAVRFIVNRDESPYKTAYKKATEGKTITSIDPVSGKEIQVKTGQPFYGWEDDLVIE